MSECQGDEDGMISLFQETDSGENNEIEKKASPGESEIQVHVLDESFFHDKLDKTNIYNEEDEEVYIAASPSFTMGSSKREVDSPIYTVQPSQLSRKTEREEHLKCDTAFSDISSDSHSVEYSDSTNTYPVINNDGQSYFISSDYSSINNLGIELSKGYFYVLSPNTFGTVKSGSEDNLAQVVDSRTMMPSSLSTTKEQEISQSTKILSRSTRDEEPCGSQRLDSFTAPSQRTLSTSSITVSESDTFEPLSTEYGNFIPSIADSSAKDQQNSLTWHKLVTSDSLTKRSEDIVNPLLMKYENNASRMEVPLLNGQPYLQVALVNDLDTSSPTSELVCTDQILGVTVPKMVTCKWEGCGIHVFTNDELIQHVNISHVTSDCDQNYPCFWKGCVREGRPFNARYKMVIHLRTHTGEKPHRCSVKGCNASFGRIENMKIHMRSHTGEKPYVCPYIGCEKVFANSSDRFKHVRTHTEKKPFHCNVSGCQKSYTDPSSLRKHKKRHLVGFVPNPKKGKNQQTVVSTASVAIT